MLRYFSLQATGTLRFDDSVRQEVEKNICSEHGVTTDCFSTPRHIVYCYMERVSSCSGSSSSSISSSSSSSGHHRLLLNTTTHCLLLHGTSE